MTYFQIEIEDMNDIWYPSIYVGNGLKFKSHESVGPQPNSLNKLWYVFCFSLGLINSLIEI